MNIKREAMVMGRDGGREVLELRSQKCIYTRFMYYHRIDFLSKYNFFRIIWGMRESKNREDKKFIGYINS